MFHLSENEISRLKKQLIPKPELGVSKRTIDMYFDYLTRGAEHERNNLWFSLQK